MKKINCKKFIMKLKFYHSHAVLKPTALRSEAVRSKVYASQSRAIIKLS